MRAPSARPTNQPTNQPLATAFTLGCYGQIMYGHPLTAPPALTVPEQQTDRLSLRRRAHHTGRYRTRAFIIAASLVYPAWPVARAQIAPLVQHRTVATRPQILS